MNNRSQHFYLPALGFALALALGVGACTTEQKHRAMAEDLIATATTKSDHEAIADHYEEEAEDAIEKAEAMRKHLESYASGNLTLIPRQKEYFIQHCKSLIQRYNEIARDSRDLAKLHREIAEGL
jgi:hypothetical protein